MVELERLKGELTAPTKTPTAPDSAHLAASRGSISLTELRLPLKADFVCSTANRPGRKTSFWPPLCSLVMTLWSFQKPPNTRSSSSFVLEHRTWWPRRWPARTAASTATR